MEMTWFYPIVLALTARERWGAAAKFNSNTMSTNWFWVIGGIILTILIVSFLVVTYKQKRKKFKSCYKS